MTNRYAAEGFSYIKRGHRRFLRRWPRLFFIVDRSSAARRVRWHRRACLESAERRSLSPVPRRRCVPCRIDGSAGLILRFCGAECVRHSSDRGNPPDVLRRFCGAVALIPELTEAADRTDASASQPLPPRTYASAGRFPLEPAGASGFYSANMSGVACWMACRVCVSMIASGLVGSMPGRFRSYCSFIRCWKDAMA